MNRYIQDTDYDDLILTEIKTNLDNTPNNRLLLQAEQKAVAQMKKYLTSRYDTNLIFTTPVPGAPDTRDQFIIMTLIDITLYHLWSKERGKVPEVRATRYQDALDWLKSVGTGQTISDLPPRQQAQVTGGAQIYSLHPPTNNRY